jgi:hypothetical protein
VHGVTIPPGRRRRAEIPAGRLVSGTDLEMQVEVVNGRRPGPRLWLSAAIHGDELNGVEIIRRVLDRVSPRDLAGCVLAVPIVNVFGFIEGSRYLPDRRDLNRSFPGSRRGSLAARLAHLFIEDVVRRSDAGIDFHTGSDHRANAPQIRGDLDDPDLVRLTRAFGAGFAVHAGLRDGSLRQAATEMGKQVLVFEGGQAHRFDAAAIAAGVDGTLRVMKALGMVANGPAPARRQVQVRSTTWIRARRAGIFRTQLELGARVEQGHTIGEISDVVGGRPTRIRAPATGWIIGINRHPLVNRGDALANLGRE